MCFVDARGKESRTWGLINNSKTSQNGYLFDPRQSRGSDWRGGSDQISRSTAVLPSAIQNGEDTKSGGGAVGACQKNNHRVMSAGAAGHAVIAARTRLARPGWALS
jgi:hypothetical protein